MAWTVPQYSRSQVDAAGRLVAAPPNTANVDEFLFAWNVVNNWRASHSFPLNTFAVGLKQRGKAVDPDCLVAQRIKRLASIRQKLARFSSMQFSQMQDIGGCRAILGSVELVDEVVSSYRSSRIKHRLVKCNDYIRNPKTSGYRGIHLIYRYYSDRKSTYNGLQVELQIRSLAQHAWATAVETVGTFVRQALKSSQGEEEWLRFFALMGTAIAMREGAPPVPETPSTSEELIKELRRSADCLDVANKLHAYGAALQVLGQEHPAPKEHYFLLALDPIAQSVKVTGYTLGELELAAADYAKIEEEIAKDSGAEAVLVSVDSIASLRQAYPNYFLDTGLFINLLEDALL